jgi:hypothetical protein
MVDSPRLCLVDRRVQYFLWKSNSSWRVHLCYKPHLLADSNNWNLIPSPEKPWWHYGETLERDWMCHVAHPNDEGLRIALEKRMEIALRKACVRLLFKRTQVLNDMVPENGDTPKL